MTEPILSSADLDVLAAELAFGLLDGAEKASALRRMLEDPTFSAMVSKWRDHTEIWIDELAPENVDGEIWSRVEAALGHGGLATAADAVAGTSSLVWKRWALLAGAASLVLSVALGISVSSRPDDAIAVGQGRTPPMAIHEADRNIAQIAGKDGAPLLSAVYYPGSGTLTMRVSDLESAEKAPELWVLDKAGKPHSLGLIDNGSSVTIELSDRLRALLVEGATVAITVEDREGAPHDAPTGEILGTAKLSTI